MAEDVVELSDGVRVQIRPVRPEDKPRFVEGFERLGDNSRYLRFHGHVKRLTEQQLSYLTEVDHHDHEALVAEDCASGDGVGVARFVRLPDRPRVAEAAVVVIDDWQGRGVGALLLARLARRAREEDVATFSALVKAENAEARALFENLGEHHDHPDEPGVVELCIELPEAPGSDHPLRRALRAAAAGQLATGRTFLEYLTRLVPLGPG